MNATPSGGGAPAIPLADRTSLLHLSHVHRGGGMFERPDNTLDTFRWCWENGSALECDCRRTRDGVGIMLHDQTLRRTARGIPEELADKDVSSELDWKDVKDVDVGSYLSPAFSGHRIPSITEVFAAMKGHPTWMCFVDEKGAGPGYIADKAREAGVLDQVYYSGPSYSKAVEWTRNVPGGKTMLWIGTWPVPGPEHGSADIERFEAHSEKVMEEIRAGGFRSISVVSLHSYYNPSAAEPFVPRASYLKSLVDEFHAHGVPVCSIPFAGGDSEEAYFRLFGLGFDGFSSDYPSTMFSVIRKLKAFAPRFPDRLDDAARTRLLDKIAAIDFSAVEELRGVLARKLAAKSAPDSAAPAPAEVPEPAPVVELAGAARAAAEERGMAELRAGRVAALLVAGGQGSRLGFDGPKGCCPVGPVSGAPLFFFHARKLLALKRRFGRAVPLYAMTSATNDAATREFFRAHGFFGLDEKDVFFFPQAMWPALDPDGNVLFDAPDNVFVSPDGHGGVLAALERSGALADMEARGIASVCYFQVDNPMVDVADPAFVGLHVSEGADWTLKVCRRTGPGEKMGMPVLRGGRTAIVEYTEFPEESLGERTPDGSLRFAWGSPALHVFSVPFLRREASAGLPVHLAHKKVPFVDASGALVRPEAPNAYKFEKFVFDALADARKAVCLAFDREEEYAPVKNRDGDKSPAACRADLSRKWARWLRAAGVDVPLGADGRPSHRIEIDPAFADSPASLAGRDLSGVDPSGDVLLADRSDLC